MDKSEERIVFDADSLALKLYNLPDHKVNEELDTYSEYGAGGRLYPLDEGQRKDVKSKIHDLRSNQDNHSG